VCRGKSAHFDNISGIEAMLRMKNELVRGCMALGCADGLMGGGKNP